MLVGGDARRDQGWHSQPRHRGSDAGRLLGQRGARADERQYLPLRRLPQHHRRDPGGAGGMRPFTYERATSAPAAAQAAAAHPNAKFIGGGTNLLDLMKLQIETPAHLIDVNQLGLARIEKTPDG